MKISTIFAKNENPEKLYRDSVPLCRGVFPAAGQKKPLKKGTCRSSGDENDLMPIRSCG